MLRVGDVLFDADLVVFDKDGTLLDFEAMWGELLRAEVAGLAAHFSGGQSLVAALYQDLGYDVERQRTLPHGPWALATTEQGLAILAATLYRYGHPWQEAVAAVRSLWQDLTAPAALSGLLQPTADLPGLFTDLKSAGIHTAIVTTDDRKPTENTLRLLGIDQRVDVLICGDDGLPVKPAPDGVLAACRDLGISPTRTAVVGDTLLDLHMGKRAGAGLLVGVLTGAGEREDLAGHADVLLDSLAAIDVPVSSSG